MSLLVQGCGLFLFDDPIRHVRLTVHYFCPPLALADAPIVIAMHGVDRNAREVRDAMASSCAPHGQIVLVPEFDPVQFPGIAAYNFGGATPGLPRSAWTFAIIDRLFEHVRQAICSNKDRFSLFGNSAGAQFVLRYLALMGASEVECAVASNCGAYMLPDLALDYPDGLGGLGFGEADIRGYFARSLTLLIGAQDNDPNALDLPRSEHAMAQGPHRQARAQWYVAHCANLARGLHTPFNWSFETVMGAGHISQSIFDRAAAILVQSS